MDGSSLVSEGGYSMRRDFVGHFKSQENVIAK
jgi:hypothetical protein